METHRRRIELALDALPTDQKVILSLLLGLDGVKATPDEIAEQMRIPKSRVREIETCALRDLRTAGGLTIQ